MGRRIGKRQVPISILPRGSDRGLTGLFAEQGAGGPSTHEQGAPRSVPGGERNASGPTGVVQQFREQLGFQPQGQLLEGIVDRQ